jgi:hypothetical protein
MAGLTQLQMAVQTDKDKFGFGLDTARIVAGFRELADALENGEAFGESIVLYRKNRLDDYPASALVFKFYESMEEMPPRIREVKQLFAPNSQFPADSRLTGEPDDKQ